MMLTIVVIEVFYRSILTGIEKYRIAVVMMLYVHLKLVTRYHRTG